MDTVEEARKVLGGKSAAETLAVEKQLLAAQVNHLNFE